MKLLCSLCLTACGVLTQASSVTALDNVGFEKRFLRGLTSQTALQAQEDLLSFSGETLHKTEAYDGGGGRTATSATVESSSSEDGAGPLVETDDENTWLSTKESVWKTAWFNSEADHGEGRHRAKQNGQAAKGTCKGQCREKERGERNKVDEEGVELGHGHSQARQLSSVDIETGELDEYEHEDVLYTLLNEWESEKDEAATNANDITENVEVMGTAGLNDARK